MESFLYKRCLQLCGFIIGGIGICAIVATIFFIYILEFDFSITCFLLLGLGVIGGYSIFVGYFLIIKQSDRAINHFCTIISLLIFIWIPQFMIKSLDIELTRNNFYIFDLFSFLCACAFYILISKVLKKMGSAA